jgi:hypothetical protein
VTNPRRVQTDSNVELPGTRPEGVRFCDGLRKQALLVRAIRWSTKVQVQASPPMHCVYGERYHRKNGTHGFRHRPVLQGTALAKSPIRPLLRPQSLLRSVANSVVTLRLRIHVHINGVVHWLLRGSTN